MGFCPFGRIPSTSKVSTVAFYSLGCWTAKIAATLDTEKEYRSSNSFQMVLKYCDDMPRIAARPVGWGLALFPPGFRPWIDP